MVAEDRFAGELGYQVVPWARGRGVAAAAARLVRDWGLDELGLERLEIHADADNIGSQRVALALGMRREGLCRGYLSARGVRRDYVLLAMTASDPREPVVPLPEPRLERRLRRRPAPGAGRRARRRRRLPGPAHPGALLLRPLAVQPRGRAGLHRRVTPRARRRHRRPLRDLRRAPAIRADGELLGAVNLMAYPEREAAETGYWVKREARGRGVATAALRLMIAYAFEQVGVERLELMTETPNVPSQRLAEKLGFRREGVARAYLASRGERDHDLVDPAHGRIDQVLYALLRPEWEGLAART